MKFTLGKIQTQVTAILANLDKGGITPLIARDQLTDLAKSIKDDFFHIDLKVPTLAALKQRYQMGVNARETAYEDSYESDYGSSYVSSEDVEY